MELESSWTHAEPLALQASAATADHSTRLALTTLPFILHQPALDPEQTRVPCELSCKWMPSHEQMTHLTLTLSSSARHVELFVTGRKLPLLGEEESTEIYLGTVSGTKQLDAVTQEMRFHVHQELLQHAHGAIRAVQSVRIRFVSLTSDKSQLCIRQLEIEHDGIPARPQAPIAPASSESCPPARDAMSSLPAAMAGLLMNNNGSGGRQQPPSPPTLAAMGGANPFSNPLVLLAVQQALEKTIDDKITARIQAKLDSLSERLAASEQNLQKLTTRLDTTQSNTNASIERMTTQLQSLNDQLKKLQEC